MSSEQGGNPLGNGLDEIGDWSVEKLNILKAYAEQYSSILQNQRSGSGKRQFRHGYIDGFAGAGEHVQKSTREIVPGSPLNALNIAHPFDEYHFVDLDGERVDRLRKKCAGAGNVHVHKGDCSTVLLCDVFPKFRYEDFARALCFLDPYGMHLKWEVLKQAGSMKSIEVFLNFPVMDINRNAKKENISDVDPDHRARMTAFWGDESWHTAMFAPSKQGNFLDLLGGENGPEMEKTRNEVLADAFQSRLKEIGGFKFVPKPIPMKNTKNAIVYYLFFAGNNEAGNKIASHIFKKYR
jgi:three-Cys-motif partner protein